MRDVVGRAYLRGALTGVPAGGETPCPPPRKLLHRRVLRSGWAENTAVPTARLPPAPERPQRPVALSGFLGGDG